MHPSAEHQEIQVTPPLYHPSVVWLWGSRLMSLSLVFSIDNLKMFHCWTISKVPGSILLWLSQRMCVVFFFFFLVVSGWLGGRLLFEKVKWEPGSQASNEMESLDYPQMEKGWLNRSSLQGCGKGSLPQAFTFSNRWVLAAGPWAFMRLSANHGLGMSTWEVSHAKWDAFLWCSKGEEVVLASCLILHSVRKQACLVQSLPGGGSESSQFLSRSYHFIRGLQGGAGGEQERQACFPDS